MTKLDPEAIAYKVMHEKFPKSTETSPHKFLPTLQGTDLFQLITAAVRADRAQTAEAQARLADALSAYDEAVAAYQEAQGEDGDASPKEYEYYEDSMVEAAHAFASAARPAATPEPPAEIHEDWRDDQENVRDAAEVEVEWRAFNANGHLLFQSDLTLTGAQAVGMFQGIGEASL